MKHNSKAAGNSITSVTCFKRSQKLKIRSSVMVKSAFVLKWMRPKALTPFTARPVEYVTWAPDWSNTPQYRAGAAKPRSRYKAQNRVVRVPFEPKGLQMPAVGPVPV